MANSKIPWTDLSLNFYFWNCTMVSPGCKHCYARTRANLNNGKFSAGKDFDNPPAWREQAVEELRHMKAGNLVFVNNHSDTYHPAAQLDWLRRIHTLIAQHPTLIFQLLTKRPELALKHASFLSWPDNLWLGVSVESPTFLHRVDTLRNIPAKHRFVSFEPLLQYIPYEVLNLSKIEWNIVGGESGRGFRAFNKRWLAPFIRLEAEEGIPLFFKQSSGMMPDQDREYNGRTYDGFPPEFIQHHEKYRSEVKQERLF